MIIIALEGGLVQAVLSDDRTVRKQECVVVDFDTDGVDDCVTDMDGDECCPARLKIEGVSKKYVENIIKITAEREAM